MYSLNYFFENIYLKVTIFQSSMGPWKEMCDVFNGTTQKNLPLIVFIGLQISVAIQFKSKATPFVVIMHYMAH
jgi:hypothetical protein